MEATREQLERWDQQHVWHPFTPMQEYAGESPIIIERAEGCHLYDLDGNQYIDGVSSLWCNIHGHQVIELDAAIRDQLSRVAHSTLLGLSNIPAIKLARKLVELAPDGLNHVFYSDDGATAVEIAIKMAFQYWQQRPNSKQEKTKYLALTNAYHGDTLGDVSVGGVARFHAMFSPLLFEALRSPSPYCYRCPLGHTEPGCDIDRGEALAKLVVQHHEELAAVVIEPLVQGAAGMVVHPEGFLKRIREVTMEYDVLLIADEVAVGFGRTGTMFACEQEDVAPDFLCLAKGLTGGYMPLAATLATDEIFNAFLGRPEVGKTFFHGHTYTGNPLGAAVALANIELFESRGILDRLPAKIKRFEEHLHRIGDSSIVGEVRHKGLIAGIELVADKKTRESFPFEKRVGREVCIRARERGVLIRPLGDVVVVMPPLAMELPMLDQLCAVVEWAIGEM